MKQARHIYQKIDGSQWRHIWLVGDIHAHFLAQLRKKLWYCRFDPWQDLLITVGDVINRGPESLRCLQLLDQCWGQSGKGRSSADGDRCAGFTADVFVVYEWR